MPKVGVQSMFLDRSPLFSLLPLPNLILFFCHSILLVAVNHLLALDGRLPVMEIRNPCKSSLDMTIFKEEFSL
jgi:hypothetical protein